MNHANNVAVIFWGPHSLSTESFARHLNAPCYLIHYMGWKKIWNAPIKYPLMWVKTWQVLIKQKPSAVMVINTPVFAPLCVYLYCKFAGIPFAMNIHGHTLGGKRWGWAVPLQRFLARRAVVNLIGTREYERQINSWHARTLFLEDPPLEVPQIEKTSLINGSDFLVTVVSTFAGDEPLDIVVEAARQTPEVHYTILGDTRLADRAMLETAPKNVDFPGYLKGNDYWKQLLSSNAVLVLTTNPYSLVAGGIEGMYCGLPLILSNQPALKDYFTRGTVFVEHTAGSLMDAVNYIKHNQEKMKKDALLLAQEKTADWQKSFMVFDRLMAGADE